MRIVEIKYISPGSVFRLIGGVGVLIGVAGGIYLALQNDLKIPPVLLNLPFLVGVAPAARAVFLGGVTGAFYGVLVGAGGYVIATAYNFFSSLFGGLDITLDER